MTLCCLPSIDGFFGLARLWHVLVLVTCMITRSLHIWSNKLFPFYFLFVSESSETAGLFNLRLKKEPLGRVATQQLFSVSRS